MCIQRKQERKQFRSLIRNAVLAASIVFAGCGDNLGPNEGENVSFEGRVTNEVTLGKQADVEGAIVHASNVRTDGSLGTLEGEATTDVEGRYELQVEGAAETVVLTAVKDDFRSEVLVVHDGEASGAIPVIPMTVESEAEAGVYVEGVARGAEGDNALTTAEVTVFVNGSLASELEAGRTTTAEIVSALRASIEAEASLLEDEQTNVDQDRVERRHREGFIRFQGELHAASSSDAQIAAIRDFEQAFIAAYVEAGVSLEAQAKAREAGRVSLLRFNSANSATARFALRQQAEILAGLTTALAIEAAFETREASETSLDVLADARARLSASLRAATTERDLDDARDAYESEVESQIMAELNITATLLGLVDTALSPAKATLETSIDAATSADAVASAYSTYYSSAEASASAVLQAGGNADLGARVVALLSAR